MRISKTVRARVARRGLALAFSIAVLTGGAADAQAAGDPVDVRDAEQQFQALKHHGEALGWRLPEEQGAPDPSNDDHYQGVARYPGPGAPVFYVTQKDNDDAFSPPGTAPGGYLNVVRMGGERPTSGERMRSNLQSRQGNTDQVDPPSDDTWLRSIRFDGSFAVAGQTLPAYVHPGGMAIIDDVLIMALDQPQGEGPDGQLVLFDLKDDPTSPQPIRAIPLDHGIDNLAAISQKDGSVLIWVNGNGGHVTRFYSIADIRDTSATLELEQKWNPSSDEDFDSTLDAVCEDDEWSTDADAYQGSAFLREPGGDLFMVMTRDEDASPLSQMCDIADLYRVDAKADGDFRLVHVASKHMYCDYTATGTICNFAAAANAYVSPSGELLMYSVPHDDADGFIHDHVRLAEFRHRDVSTVDSRLRRPTADAGGPYEVDEGAGVQLSGSAEPAADRPWAELYDDDHWEDRSIVSDYDDRALLELEDFNNLDAFNDKTSSVRWRSPVGLDLELYEDDHFRGEKRVLKGTGHTQTISDLKNVGFGGMVSSARWVGAEAPLSYAWDLDNDGAFDDSTSASPTFGPTKQEGIYTVRLQVTDGSGASDVDSATVTVRNAPPDCSTVAPTPDTLWATDHEFRPITLAGATDPGDDPLTLTVNSVTQDEDVDGIGDGHTTPDAALVADRSEQVNLRAERSSVGDGRIYHVAFRVSDDRGASCTGVADVSVPKGIGTGPAIDSGAEFDSFATP